MVPVPGVRLPGNLLEPHADHVAYIVQRLRNQSEMFDTYSLAHRQPVWVEFAELEAAEEELDRSCIITVRP